MRVWWWFRFSFSTHRSHICKQHNESVRCWNKGFHKFLCKHWGRSTTFPEKEDRSGNNLTEKSKLELTLKTNCRTRGLEEGIWKRKRERRKEKTKEHVPSGLRKVAIVTNCHFFGMVRVRVYIGECWELQLESGQGWNNTRLLVLYQEVKIFISYMSESVAYF